MGRTYGHGLRVQLMDVAMARRVSSATTVGALRVVVEMGVARFDANVTLVAGFRRNRRSNEGGAAPDQSS